MVAKIEHKNRTGCPIACVLDIIGDHWTLLIIRNLLFLGLHEYKDMLETDEQISSNILSNRLKKLEKDGLIASICHPESKRRKLYYLTGKGKDLIHIMFEMVLWGKKNISHLLAIPEDQLNLLNTDPDKYKSLVLLQTEEWEKEYLHGQ